MDSRQAAADEFCLLEPLAPINDDIDDDADDVIAESGISIGMRRLSLGKQQKCNSDFGASPVCR